MKKALKIIAIVIVSALVVIQFIRPDFTNPAVNSAETLQTPENIGAILKRSCADCHSNETVYPWYARVQPAAWFLKDHIDEGRRELNFSIWNTYEKNKQSRKFEEICEQIKYKTMPLPAYLWVHWSAKLSDEEIKTLCDWTASESVRLANMQ